MIKGLCYFLFFFHYTFLFQDSWKPWSPTSLLVTSAPSHEQPVNAVKGVLVTPLTSTEEFSQLWVEILIQKYLNCRCSQKKHGMVRNLFFIFIHLRETDSKRAKYSIKCWKNIFMKLNLWFSMQLHSFSRFVCPKENFLFILPLVIVFISERFVFSRCSNAIFEWVYRGSTSRATISGNFRRTL